MRKKGPTKTKNEGKGAYKDQNEGNRPSKNFFDAKKYIFYKNFFLLDFQIAKNLLFKFAVFFL